MQTREEYGSALGDHPGKTRQMPACADIENVYPIHSLVDNDFIYFVEVSFVTLKIFDAG